jgi:hypothetical protein
MKRWILLPLVFVICNAWAQTPVQWKFSFKKLATDSYEVHFTALVQGPWKIYSQSTPGGGPLPTNFTFNKNPLLSTQGSVKEIGSVHKQFEDVFGIDVLYYKESVDFVQVIKLKTKAKTKFSGAVQYMCCNDQQCLPPASIPFSIALN